MPDIKPLYDRLVEAGCEIGSHETDLHVKATPEAKAIIAQFEAEGGISNKEYFRSAIDKSAWIDLPFHYTPGWERRSRPLIAKPPEDSEDEPSGPRP